MNKRLNVRLLVRVAAATVLVLAVLHAVHLFQAGRHARNFRSRGETAMEEKNYPQAVLYLGRYLTLRPDEPRAEGQYGLALEKVAKNDTARWRAYRVLERALRGDAGNVEVRQTLASLAIQLRRFDAALHILEPLRTAEVDRAELEDTLAWCHLGLGDREKAIQGFRAAIKLKPDRVASYENVARLHLRHDQRTAAERVMDELIAANPKKAEAFVSRARFRENLNRLTEASADFARAVALAREDAHIFLQASSYQLRNGRPDEARPLLEQAIRFRNGDTRPVLELARLEHDSGRLTLAMKTLENAAAQDDPAILALLVEMGLEQGMTDKIALWSKKIPEESPFREYVEAHQLMRQGEWVSALRRLEPLTRSLAKNPGWSGCVWLSMARCHEGCHDNSRRLEACRRAVATDNSWRAARVALADALTRVDKLDEACKVWKRLMSETEPPMDGWLAYARTLSRRNLQPALVPPDWKEVQRLLDRAEEARSDAVLVSVARAESMAMQDQLARMETYLLTEMGRLGEKMPLILTLADVQASRGRFADALLIVKKYTTPAARAARIHYAAAFDSRSKEAREALEEATHDLDRLSAVDAGVVLRARTETVRARGDLRLALELCRTWCRRCPQDLAAFLTLMQLADRLVSEEDLREAVAGLRVIEGGNGIRWRCAEVMRMLTRMRSEKADATALRTIRRLLTEAESLGRESAAGLEFAALLRGRLNEAAGRTEDAVTEYLLAFERGERGEWPTYHLMQMLLDRQRLNESDRLLRVVDREGVAETPSHEPFALYPLPTMAPRLLTPSLARLGAEVAVRQKDYPRAVELASRALPGESGSHVDRLWLADLYDKAGRPAEASRILDQLSERHGEVGDVWVALVRQLLRAGQREKAEDVLPRAQKRLASTEDGWQLYLAECHEILGKSDQAERFYKLALEASPHDPLVLRRFARFYIAADEPEKAIPLLATLASSPYEAKEHIGWARRMLVTLPFQFVILKRELPMKYRKNLSFDALQNLLPVSKDVKEEALNERARGLLVASQAGRESEGLRQFAKTFSSRSPLSGEEQLRLVQLYDVGGDPIKADESLAELLKRDGFNGQYVAGQVRLHLSRGNLPEARVAVKRLQELEPDSERTKALLALCDS